MGALDGICSRLSVQTEHTTATHETNLYKFMFLDSTWYSVLACTCMMDAAWISAGDCTEKASPALQAAKRLRERKTDQNTLSTCHTAGVCTQRLSCRGVGEVAVAYIFDGRVARRNLCFASSDTVTSFVTAGWEDFMFSTAPQSGAEDLTVGHIMRAKQRPITMAAVTVLQCRR